MSLELHFFKNRHKKELALIDQGFYSLEDLEIQYKVTIDDLIESGYLKNKVIMSTADVLDYCVSDKGKKLLLQVKYLDLVLVRPNCIERLI